MSPKGSLYDASQIGSFYEILLIRINFMEAS